MSLVLQSDLRNRLLVALPAEEFQILQPHLAPVELRLRTSLTEPGQRIDHVYFLETGIASVVAVGSDSQRIEVGHVGWEGMTGTPLCLGVPEADTHTFMQAAGTGTRIPAAEFTTVVDAHPAIRSLLLRYVYTHEVQVAHSALAKARYGLQACLARWILMAHDRTTFGDASKAGDSLPLTHEFLSLMLGVRRAGVTEAMGILQSAGLVEANRGRVRVLDRQGLARAAGAAYGRPEAIYDRLLG